jgi:hypothetical protein
MKRESLWRARRVLSQPSGPFNSVSSRWKVRGRLSYRRSRCIRMMHHSRRTTGLSCVAGVARCAPLFPSTRASGSLVVAVDYKRLEPAFPLVLGNRLEHQLHVSASLCN